MEEQFYLQEKNGVVTLKCRALDAVKGIVHGFSTRHGGVSEGCCSAMSFSYNKEPEGIVDENFRRFCAANGLPFHSLVLTHQTHTAHVVTADASYKEQGRHRRLRDTDGLVTAENGLGLVCFAADCVPLLLADKEGGAVAAVHAGWRGTVHRIAAHAVEQMVAAGTDPKNIVAAIGPSIGPCHFEVGPEVQAEFTAAFGAKLPVVPSVREGHTMVNLWEANRCVLLESGVLPQNVHVAEVCTYCDHENYHSHRYTAGQRGSLIGAIAKEDV